MERYEECIEAEGEINIRLLRYFVWIFNTKVSFNIYFFLASILKEKETLDNSLVDRVFDFSRLREFMTFLLFVS